MLDGSDIGLLREWMAYFEIDPFGEERADVRNAIACMTIASAMGLKKNGGGKFSIKDFMPEFGKKPANVYDPITARSILKKLYGKDSRNAGRKP